MLRAAADRTGCWWSAEGDGTSPQIPLVAQYADILQVGGAQHAELHPAARAGQAAQAGAAQARYFRLPLKELLLSAEYILAGGN